MALPKRRHSTCRGRKRRTHWKARVTSLSACPQCKRLKPAHQVCIFCGYYAGRQVIEIKAKKKKAKK